MYRLAPGLVLRLDSLVPSVEGAVRSFLAPYPKLGDDNASIVSLCGLPAPEANGRWEDVAANPFLRSRRRGELLYFECDAGSAWVEGARAGFVPAPSLERQAAGLLLPGLVLELARSVNLVALHAAAVAVDGKAAILPGPSGAGKSTLFREAGRLGLQLLSDDLIWLREKRDGGLGLHPIPRGEPAEPCPPPTVWEAEPKLIAFPEIVSRPGCRALRMQFDEAVGDLLEQGSAASGGPARISEFRRCVRAARSLPCIRLEVGPDPAAGARRLYELLTARDST